MQRIRTLTKITPPRSSGAVPRPRLFRLLDRLRAHPAIWVAGPAGSGKTTLLSSYLAARRDAVLWYQIDEGDADPASFFYFLRTAVHRAAPRRRGALPLLTPEHQPALTTFTRNYVRAMFERFPGRVMLVLDNFQMLPETSPVQLVLRTAIEEAPERFTIAVLSRELPPPILRSLQGDGRLACLGWDELRLEDREAARIVRAHRVAPRAARNWIREAGGWVAGLVLLMERARLEQAGVDGAGRAVPEYGFDYFAGQILDGLPEAQQHLLLMSAFLSVMSEPGLEALTGRGDAGRFLSGLTRRNYFTTRHPGSHTAYQYHPLFRAFLLQRARDVFGDSSCRRLEARAAVVLESEGEYGLAAEYLVRLGDWDGLERMLAGVGWTLLYQGRHQTILGWLASIPATATDQRPWLQLWHGQALMFVDPAQAMRVLESAWRQFDARDESRGCYMSWAAAADAYMMIREFEGVETWLERLRRLRQRHPEFDSPFTEARVVSAAHRVLTLAAPDDPGMPDWESRALKMLHSAVPADLRLLTASYVLVRHAWFGGSRDTSARVVEIARALLGSTQVSPIAEITWCVLEAQFHFWYGGAGAERAARRCADRGFALAEEHDLHGMDPLLVADRVYLHLAEDDHRAASAELERMPAPAIPRTAYDESHIHFMHAWCAWTAGRLASARAHADAAVRLAEHARAPSGVVLSSLARAQVATALRDHRGAHRDFARARRIARRYGFTNPLLMCHAAVARYAFERGQRSRGRAFLKAAFAIGAAERHMRVPFIRKRTLARLCAEALEHGIETEYARELVRERDLRPDPPPVAVARWPWRLEIRCLGDWAVRRDGEPLHFGRKTPKRTLLLLKTILALGGRDVPEASLTDALWEHDDADSARNALSTALHRLRRLLGTDVVLQGDGRIGLDPAAVWVDAWAFEYLVDAARAARRSGSAGDMTLHLRRALDLYRGHFLEGMADAAGALELRERLRSRVTREIGRLGEHVEKGAAWREAADLYLQGLDMDDLVEAHYQGLLRCYQQLGLRAEAVETWRRCVRALNHKLGVDPAPATERLYRAATGAGPAR